MKQIVEHNQSLKTQPGLIHRRDGPEFRQGHSGKATRGYIR